MTPQRAGEQAASLMLLEPSLAQKILDTIDSRQNAQQQWKIHRQHLKGMNSSEIATNFNVSIADVEQAIFMVTLEKSLLFGMLEA